jgi:hypothetical protein
MKKENGMLLIRESTFVAHTLNLLQRLHRDSDCGRDGMHSAECNAAVGAFGFDSYDELRNHGWLPCQLSADAPDIVRESEDEYETIHPD